MCLTLIQYPVEFLTKDLESEIKVILVLVLSFDGWGVMILGLEFRDKQLKQRRLAENPSKYPAINPELRLKFKPFGSSLQTQTFSGCRFSLVT